MAVNRKFTVIESTYVIEIYHDMFVFVNEMCSFYCLFIEAAKRIWVHYRLYTKLFEVHLNDITRKLL